MEANGAVPARRVGDVERMVRRWADQGAIRRDVAARFLAHGEWERRRRNWSWLSAGAPRRRRGEMAEAPEPSEGQAAG